jgi:hypothetical protein
MEYTKGPWIKEESNLKQEYHFLIASNLQQMWIAKIGNPYDDVEITENNANLIAACPDMYEALIDLIEVMAGEQEAEDELEKAWGKLGRTAIEKARRVLSKAEGRNDQ